jgi:simple sugar transport system permease protein
VGSLIKIEKRNDISNSILLFSPVLAIILTLLSGAIIFYFLGFQPLEALKIFFIIPIADLYGFSELLLKATPLCIIAIGLSFCFKTNNWNIGAEGQLIFGGIVSGGVALLFYNQEGFFILPIIILTGALGGAIFALIPAILKTYFNTNEILTSLMLVYVAKLLLDYLVVGPWSNPEGFNFPETRMFSDSARMPLLFEGLRIHAGIFIALMLVALSWFIFFKTFLGFQMKVSGLSLKTARYAGYKGKKTILLVFIISGACAGLAGVGEITGPIGQLHREISPEYGFTAIIVTFLGRLNPLGIIFASLIVALTYLGAESAQIFLQVPKSIGQIFQALILFFLLASDFLLYFKVKFLITQKKNEY